MASLERSMTRKLDRGATVENANVAPQSAPEKDIKLFDEGLVEQLHRSTKQRRARKQRAVAPVFYRQS